MNRRGVKGKMGISVRDIYISFGGRSPFYKLMRARRLIQGVEKLGTGGELL